MAQRLQQAQQERQTDSGRVSDPKVPALFATIAVVLGEAMIALEHSSTGSESIWQSDITPQEGTSPVQD